MRNRRRHGRRGLSTVITTLLMVAAVSIMGAALMTWSSSSFAAQQRAISNQTDSRINLIKENLVLEDVWFFTNMTGSYANVTIRNAGELAVTVSNIYVNNTEYWDDGEIILTDGVATIVVEKIDSPVPWEAGRPQSIWVQTERGGDIKQTWRS